MKWQHYRISLTVLTLLFSTSVFANKFIEQERDKTYYLEITSEYKNMPVNVGGTVMIRHKDKQFAEAYNIPFQATPVTGVYVSSLFDVTFDTDSDDGPKVLVKIIDRTSSRPNYEGETLLTSKGHHIHAYVDSLGNIHASSH